MGTENRALVGDALELIVEGVAPYVERVRAAGGSDGAPIERDLVSMLDILADAPVIEDGEASARAISGYARELQAVWDAWARIRPFEAAETYRALDTAALLLRATGAEDEAAVVRDLATVPLALFAARALADYVALDSAALAEEETVPDEETVSDTVPATSAVSADDPVGDSIGEQEPDQDRDAEPEPEPEPEPELPHPFRLRAVNTARHVERAEDARAPASIRALRVIDPALPLVTWSELSDTITALLATGRLDPGVLAAFTRKSLDERARHAVEGAAQRGITIRPEHVAWVVSVLRTRYTGTARVTRAIATSLVAEYIAELAPRAGVDPRRVRQDMMAWVDVERA